MPEAIVSRILRLPGYGVYAYEADESAGTLWLWVRQVAPEPYYVCGGCGISVRDVHSWTERRLRDLPWGPWQGWRGVEVHRVRCRRCGVRTERVPFVMGKAHSTTRLEAGVARDCEAAPVSRVARTRPVPPETPRRMDKRVLRRWATERPRKPLRYLGVDEIYLGQRDKFLTVVSDLDRGRAQTAHGMTGARTAGDKLLDGGGGIAGQQGHLLGDGIGGARLLGHATSAAQEAKHAVVDLFQDLGARVCDARRAVRLGRPQPASPACRALSVPSRAPSTTVNPVGRFGPRRARGPRGPLPSLPGTCPVE